VCGSDNGARQTVRDAETEIEVIESGEKYSLLRMFPKTGRTHQLRLHAKFIGHPIVGDKKYSFGGIDNVTEEDKNSRLMLHAKSLELLHPKTGEKIKIETAIPF
jgi:23S rRNA-/tRNA-specific pseudouridylate synthase